MSGKEVRSVGDDDIPRWSCGLWGISVSAAGVPAAVRGDMMAVAAAVVEGGMVGWSELSEVDEWF